MGGYFQISLTDNTSSVFTNNGSISSSNGCWLTIWKTFTNNGAISLNNGKLQLVYSSTATNNGAITVSNGGYLEDQDDGAFTNAAGASITVRGAGSVAMLSGISVTNAGSITFSAGATGYIGTFDAPWSNTGTITVESKATLHLVGPSNTTADLTGIVNHGGIISIDNTLINTGAVLSVGPGTGDPTVVLNSYETVSSIVGGTIVDKGAGLHFNYGVLSGVTYDGTVNLSAAGSRVFIADGFTANNLAGTGPGEIELTGEGSVINAAGGQTFDNATLDIGATGAGAVLALESSTNANSVLTLGSHFKIVQAGLVAIIKDNHGRALDAIVNNGTIIAGFSGGTFEMMASGALGSLRHFTNNGSIVVSNGEVMDLQPTVFTNLVGSTLTGGSYEAGAGSTIELKTNTRIVVDAATIILDGPGSMIQALNSATKAQATLDSSLYQITASGTLEVLGGRDWSSTRTFNNAGALELAGGTFTVSYLTNSGAIAGYGAIVGGLTNNKTITATGGTLDIQDAVAGAGQFIIEAASVLQLDSAAGLRAVIAFAGAGGALALGDVAGFTGRIQGFTTGQTIDLLNTTASAASFAAGKLTITNGAAAVAILRLTGPYAGDTFNVASDGHGGTNITLMVPAVPAVARLTQAAAAMPSAAVVGAGHPSASSVAAPPLIAAPRT